VIPHAEECWMGSPDNEEGRHEPHPGSARGLEALVRCRLAPFAIGTTEVTVEQYARCRPGHAHDQEFAPGPNCPVNEVNFLDVARYCNWLSAREGIPASEFCYLLTEGTEPELTIPADSTSRLGYRVPTEAEWEYACRVGSTTSRFFGESPEWLSRYAWYNANWEGRSWPVGSLRPNPLGLFDLYGNVSEWCTHARSDEARAREIRSNGPHPQEVRRGNSAPHFAPDLRSAARIRTFVGYRHLTVGFRLARTLTRSQDTVFPDP
jgi:hypothetical protein